MPYQTHSFGLETQSVDLSDASVTINLGGQSVGVNLTGTVSAHASFGVTIRVHNVPATGAWNPLLLAPPWVAGFDDTQSTETPGYWWPKNTAWPDYYYCDWVEVTPAFDAPSIPQPSGYPAVSASAGIDGMSGVAVDVEALAQALLDSGADPLTYWSALTQAPALVADGLEGLFGDVFDDLVPTQSTIEEWWAYSLLTTVLPAFESAFDAAESAGLDTFLGDLTSLPNFVQALRAALVDLAKGLLEQLGDQLQLALDLLLLAGQTLSGLSPVQLYAWLVDLLLVELREQWSNTSRRAWVLGWLEECVERLADMVGTTGVGFVTLTLGGGGGGLPTPQGLIGAIVARVSAIAASYGSYWSAGKEQVRALVEAAFEALEPTWVSPSSVATTLSIAIAEQLAPQLAGGPPPGSVAYASRGGAGPLQGAVDDWDPARALVELLLWIREAATGGFDLLGQAFATVLNTLGDGAQYVGRLLAAMGEVVAEVGAWTQEQFVQFINALGTWKNAAAEWIVDAWETFRDCILASAWAWVLQWLQALLGILAGWVDDVIDDLNQLGKALQWLVELPQQLLESPQLAGAQQSLQGLSTILQEGPGQWLNQAAQAAGKDMAEFTKELIQSANPIMSWINRLSGAVLDALTVLQEQASAAGEQAGSALAQFTGQGLDLMGQLEQAVERLREIEETLWRVLFKGEGGQDPWVAVIRAEGVISDPIEVEGGVVTGVELLPPLPGSFEDAACILEALTDEQYVALELRKGERLRVPHPTDTTRLDWEDLPPPPQGLHEFTLPIPLPIPFGDASVAIARLPEFWVMDMRYHMPYGPTLGCLKVADLDHDGFVRGWEVDAIQAAIAAGSYDPALDCDGDGEVTADDLQLAIEQQSRYVNGVMYRPTTAPIGFWCSTSPYDWAFTALTSLEEESIPGMITRRGLNGIVDGQILIPLPTPPALDSLLAPGLTNYPIRYHLESRTYIDVFDSITLDDYGSRMPGLPLVATPGTRNDLILRGGQFGTDWQAHIQSEPLNPLLRTWKFRLDAYFKAILAYVVSVRGDFRVQVVYETETPLIAVIEQWHERFSTLASDPPEPPDELAIPVPWQMFKDIFEYTNVPRFSRGAIGAMGPFVDLLFDWTDEGNAFRAALGFLRQGLLSRWEPAPTWDQLRFEVAHWDPAAVGGAPVLAAVREAIDEVQAALGLGDQDPVFVPARIEKLAKAKARAALEAQGAVTLPTPIIGGVVVAGHGANAPRFARGTHKAPAQKKPSGISSAAPPSSVPAPDDPALALQQAETKLEEVFEADAGRFAASLDQLVSDLDATEPFDIPGCGEGFRLVNPFIFAWPLTPAQTLDAAEGDTDGLADTALMVRGNPFHKPIYHTVIEFAEDAKLYAAPRRAWSLFLGPIGAGEKGVVEASRVLQGADDSWWLWVRVADWRYGWIQLHESVWRPMFSPQAVAQNFAEDLIREVVDPEILADLEVLAGYKALTKIEASPNETIDETRYAPIARAALARLSADPASKSEEDLRIRALYNAAREEVRTRIFGHVAVNDPDLDTSDEQLGLVFNQLSLPKREKLWAHTGAWLKCAYYFPKIGELMCGVIGLMMEEDFRGAWDQVIEAAQNCAEFTFDEALLASQMAAPYMVELIETAIDTGEKLKKIKDAVSGAAEDVEQGEVEASGSGKLPALDFWNQQQEGPEWTDVGALLLRLLIDDEDEPGKPPPEVPAGGDSKYDWGITFSYDVKVKDVDVDAGVEEGARSLHLATPAVAEISASRREAEAGATLNLVVSKWGAIVTQGETKKLVKGLDTARIPEAVRAQVQWRMKLPGATTWGEPLANQGHKLEFTFDDPAHLEPGLAFEALLGESSAGLTAAEGIALDEVVFLGQVAPVRYVVKADGPTGSATLKDKDGNALAEYALETTKGAHSLGVDLSALATLTLEHSPLKVEFPETVKVAREPKPDDAKQKPPPAHVGGKDISGKVALDLGNDSLTITWSTEAGAGVGAGAQVGSGVGAAPTLNVKKFWLQPKFNLDLFTSRTAVGLFMRLCLKTCYHAIEALHLAMTWAEQYAQQHPDNWLVKYGGFYFWWQVFSVFAVKDALYELVDDHADWIAKVLEKVGWVFEFEASGNFDAAAYVNIEANAIVTGKAFIPLSTILAPVIEFLCAADPHPPEDGASLADKIVPVIKATFEDCIKVKVGGLPVTVEVETRGKLAEATFSIPEGSPLMAKLEELGKALADAAVAFKTNAFANPPQPVDEVVGFRVARTILSLLDKQVDALVIEKSGKKAWKSASPFVGMIMSQLTGQPSPDAPTPEVTPEGQAVLDMLAGAQLAGVQLEPGVPLHEEPNEQEPGDGRVRLWLHLDDAGRARMQAEGFTPPSEEEVLETKVFETTLPQTPRAIGWNRFDDTEGEAAGLSISGLVAGFDSDGEADAFAGSRGALVDPAVAGGTWRREGKSWTWIETDLVPILGDQGIPLPDLALAGPQLRMTFEELEVGTVTDDGTPFLAQASLAERVGIWKVVLLEAANAEEARRVRAKVLSNQGTWFPTVAGGTENAPEPESPAPSPSGGGAQRPGSGWKLPGGRPWGQGKDGANGRGKPSRQRKEAKARDQRAALVQQSALIARNNTRIAALTKQQRQQDRQVAQLQARAAGPGAATKAGGPTKSGGPTQATGKATSATKATASKITPRKGSGATKATASKITPQKATSATKAKASKIKPQKRSTKASASKPRRGRGRR